MAASTSAALSFANLAAARSSSLTGSPVSSVKASGSSRASAPLACRAQKAGEGEVPAPPVSRRAVISIAAAAAAAVAAITAPIHPADAAYGEEANIFGPVKVETGFVTYKGNGFKVDIPSRWGPSKEVEFPGTVLRYEDNFDSLSNLAVMVIPDGKTSIKDYGSPEKFLESMSYLLGKQSYGGKTQSEGGFDKDAVATAAILESSTPTINGKDYYSIQVLTRTADGGEGGRHQLFVATVSGGKLYLLKTQAGDKRWFKGTRKYIEGIANSFSVA